MGKEEANEMYRMIYTQPKEDITYMLMGALDKISKAEMLCTSALNDYVKDTLTIYDFPGVIKTILKVLTGQEEK